MLISGCLCLLAKPNGDYSTHAGDSKYNGSVAGSGLTIEGLKYLTKDYQLNRYKQVGPRGDVGTELEYGCIHDPTVHIYQ